MAYAMPPTPLKKQHVEMLFGTCFVANASKRFHFGENLAQNAPDSGQNLPDLEQNLPDLKQNLPDLGVLESDNPPGAGR